MGSLVLAGQPGFAGGKSFSYDLPKGWKKTTAKGAVMAATAPDDTMQIIVWELPVKDARTAKEIAQNQLKKITYKKVVNPPTDMSRLKASFNADSVAKMALGRTRSDGADIFYRAFVFVKGGTFVVIESFATKEATKDTFKTSDETINTFRFN